MPAPRKASKKQASAEEARLCRVLPKLKLIKTKYTARELRLSRRALSAMKEINDIEAFSSEKAAEAAVAALATDAAAVATTTGRIEVMHGAAFCCRVCLRLGACTSCGKT